MSAVECYIGLGGNLQGTLATMRLAVCKLKKEPTIWNLCTSPLYATTPVEMVDTRPFLNSVCRFQTELSAVNLWSLMQSIMLSLGQLPKAKNEPRLIDLDILFYGSHLISIEELVIPHPRWHERLFVIQPLADLTEELPIGLNTKELLTRFHNPYQEKITQLPVRID